MLDVHMLNDVESHYFSFFFFCVTFSNVEYLYKTFPNECLSSSSFELHIIAMAKVNAVPFHEKEYWKNRFEKEKHFEWLVTWDDIKKEFEPYLDGTEDVLHLGNEKCIQSLRYCH